MANNFLNKVSETESQIVALLAKKDRQAVSLAYKHYGPNLYGVVLRILGNEEDAQEVMQDSFVKVWQNADKYDAKKGRLFTWMLNIARRTAIDKTRSAQYKATRRNESIDSDRNFRNEWSVTDRHEDAGLRKVIDSIDPKYRVIIDLIYYQGYTQTEVQKELNIPLGTVKSRVRLAMNELRSKLADPKNGGYLTLIWGIVEKLGKSF